MNKVCGTLMFFLPFIVNTKYLLPYALIILAVAYVSVFDEIHYILRDGGKPSYS